MERGDAIGIQGGDVLNPVICMSFLNITVVVLRGNVQAVQPHIKHGCFHAAGPFHVKWKLVRQIGQSNAFCAIETLRDLAQMCMISMFNTFVMTCHEIPHFPIK